MDLPSFIWLWRIAAWSMGLSITAYGVLALTGGFVYFNRQRDRPLPRWLRLGHITLGIIFVSLILLLLSIGIIGTLGEYGHLGHSSHLPAGLFVVGLVIASAWSASRIDIARPWARRLHLALNSILFFALVTVTLTGWSVVQKYL